VAQLLMYFLLNRNKTGLGFESALVGLDSVILTPHVGGSTQEAQENIGTEVAVKLTWLS
jgi:D-3-phosphoglycerate dehydrogenase